MKMQPDICRAVLVWQGSLVGWNHVAVVYNNKIPSLYINGLLAKQVAVASPRQTVNPSYNFGGGTFGLCPGLLTKCAYGIQPAPRRNKQ